MVRGQAAIDGLREVQADLQRQIEEEEDDLNLLGEALHHVGEALDKLEAYWLRGAKRGEDGETQFEVIAVADNHVPVLRGLPEIDNILIDPGRALLLVGQFDGAQNGIWIVREGDWERPTFQPDTTDRVEVIGGLIYEDSVWVCAAPEDYSQLPHKRKPS
jgi:hypothetical protein